MCREAAYCGAGTVEFLLSPEGEFSVDRTGKKSGRGAYICPRVECLEKARKGHRLERSFACAIDPAVYEALAAELAAGTVPEKRA